MNATTVEGTWWHYSAAGAFYNVVDFCSFEFSVNTPGSIEPGSTYDGSTTNDNTLFDDDNHFPNNDDARKTDEFRIGRFGTSEPH